MLEKHMATLEMELANEADGSARLRQQLVRWSSSDTSCAGHHHERQHGPHSNADKDSEDRDNELAQHGNVL